MDDFEKELKEDFLQEASDLLADAEQVFLDLETSQGDPAVLDEIFRFAHNLKGTSRAVGFGEVAEFTHEFENLILKIKEGEITVTAPVVSLLLKCNDHVNHMIETLKADLNAQCDSDSIIVELKEMLSKPPSDDQQQKAGVPSETDEVASFADATEEFIELVDNTKKAPDYQPSQAETQQIQAEWDQAKKETPKKAAQKNAKKAGEEEFIRVNLQKIERLNNYVGELILLQTVLEQRKISSIRDEIAVKSISQLSKISKEIQDISMGMRMVPLRNTMQKMNRIVRDTSATLGKKVNLHLSGQETEIDKTVLDSLMDPLVHTVRNSVDHGIEDSECRVAGGKEPSGNVWIRAYHRGNQLVIEVQDDGMGVDTDAVFAKAVEKGIVSKDKKLSKQQILEFLFHPGFSTKEQVSEVSGRGVGMDVLRTNIHQLGGEIKLESEFGRGSLCQILLPLTLAIIDGMVIKAKEESYILPLNQISEFLRPAPELLTHISGIGDCLTLRGDVMPVFDLSADLSRGANPLGIHQAICIVCKIGEQNLAIKVDDVINQQQIVVKSLGPDIRNQKGFMGSSILGDGRPSFIIDIQELYKERLIKPADKNLGKLGV